MIPFFHTVRQIIEGTVKPTGLNRISQAFGSAPEYNRNVPRGLREKVLKRDKYRCRNCGFVGESSELHVDHIKPVSKGGKTVEENLQILCSTCNLTKGGN